MVQLFDKLLIELHKQRIKYFYNHDFALIQEMIRVLKNKKILALSCLICAQTFLWLFCLVISQACLFTNKNSANLYIEQFFIEDDQYLQFLIFTPLGLR